MAGIELAVQQAWTTAMNLGPSIHAHSQRTTGLFLSWHFTNAYLLEQQCQHLNELQQVEAMSLLPKPLISCFPTASPHYGAEC